MYIVCVVHHFRFWHKHIVKFQFLVEKSRRVSSGNIWQSGLENLADIIRFTSLDNANILSGHYQLKMESASIVCKLRRCFFFLLCQFMSLFFESPTTFSLSSAQPLTFASTNSAPELGQGPLAPGFTTLGHQMWRAFAVATATAHLPSSATLENG